MFEDDEDTEIIKFPALDENDESNFDYPYGLGYTTKQFHDQREIMDDASWRALYMCQPIEREGQLYDPEGLKRYFSLPDREPDVVFAVCDTKETGPDYCAMPIVMKYGEEYYIDTWLCDNGNPDILEHRIAQMFVDKKVKLARFESNRGGTLFAKDVQDIVREKGGSTKITTKWNQTNKETRILTRAPWVKEHCVFRDESIYDKEYRTAMDMLCQYNMAGKNKHDDVPDVLADLADYVEGMGVASVTVGRRMF
jgi:predicted phage terminase large subunit-like protein